MSDKYHVPDLNELATVIHARNVRLGFYEPEKVRPFDGMLANVHGEVSEALEEWRAGRGMTEIYWSIHHNGDPGVLEYFRAVPGGRLQVRNYDYDFRGGNDSVPEWLDVTPERVRNMPNMKGFLKPEGIPSELADIIIRVLDICGANRIDIAAAIADKMAYNETREYRHGGKRS